MLKWRGFWRGRFEKIEMAEGFGVFEAENVEMVWVFGQFGRSEQRER
jgi:hypothetical protein